MLNPMLIHDAFTAAYPNAKDIKVELSTYQNEFVVTCTWQIEARLAINVTDCDAAIAKVDEQLGADLARTKVDPRC